VVLNIETSLAKA